MCACDERLSEVMTKLTDICSRLTSDAKKNFSAIDLQNLKFVDLSFSQLTLDRALDGGKLLDLADELLCGVLKCLFIYVFMQMHDADIFFWCSEQKLDDPRGFAQGDRLNTRNLRIECSGMAGFIDLEDFL